MKYLGITGGRIIEGFSVLPSIDLTWAIFEDETFLLGTSRLKKANKKYKKYYDVQFAWLFWYFTIGCIHKRINAMH